MAEAVRIGLEAAGGKNDNPGGAPVRLELLNSENGLVAVNLRCRSAAAR